MKKIRRTISFFLVIIIFCSIQIDNSKKANAASSYTIPINWNEIEKVDWNSVSGPCAAYALAYARTILDGYAHSYTEYYINGECDWSRGDYIRTTASSNIGVLKELYNQINQNCPVIVHVMGPSNQHWVAVVGYQNVTDVNNLTMDNFLMIDSATSRFTQLYPLSHSYRNYTLHADHAYCYPKFSGGAPGTPKGVVDSISGGAGCINVVGWAYDQDDLNYPLGIHVYIGGPAGIGELHALTANKERADVDSVYGVGKNHGFSETIRTGLTGSQEIVIYALNVGTGDNVIIGRATVTIASDSDKPTISSFYVKNETSFGYDVYAKASDNSGVTKVLFPTWPVEYGSEKAKWYDGVYDSASGYWKCHVNVNDFNGYWGNYMTHAYAYDASGNNSRAILEKMILIHGGSNLGNQFTAVINKSTSSELGLGITKNSVNVELIKTTSDASSYYTWSFSKNADGSYTIVNQSNGFALDVSDSGTGNGTNIAVYHVHKEKNQRFYLVKDGKFYRIRTSYVDKYIDCTGNGNVVGTNIQLHDNADNGSAKKYSIVQIANHKWDDGKITTKATCETNGKKTYTCTDCGVTKTETIPATGHNWGNWTKLNANNHQRICKNNASHIETAAHNWDKGKVTKQPAPGINGEKKYTCKDCSAVKTEPIEALPTETKNPTQYFTLGDVDMDGKIKAVDARLALRAAARLEALPENSQKLADMDADGKVKAGDARVILRIAARLDPAPEKKIAIAAQQ